MQEHDIKVPAGIALVGFSNEPFTSLVHPSISTVSQHSGEIGKIATKTFLKRIKSNLNKMRPIQYRAHYYQN